MRPFKSAFPQTHFCFKDKWQSPTNWDMFSESVMLLSRIQLFVTPWTVAPQAPLFMGFSRQEYWSGLPCPLLGDLSISETEPRSPILQVDSLPSEPWGKPKNMGVGSLIPSPGDLPNPGIEPGFPALQVDSLPAELPGKPICIIIYKYTELNKI